MIIQKYIKGYQFSSEEAAKEARGKSTKSHSFPSKEADFTIYWQNYDISLGLKPFWYMVDSGGLERSLGEPTEFLVNGILRIKRRIYIFGKGNWRTLVKYDLRSIS